MIIIISPVSYQITLENATRNQPIPFAYLNIQHTTVYITLTFPCKQSKHQPKHPAITVVFYETDKSVKIERFFFILLFLRIIFSRCLCNLYLTVFSLEDITYSVVNNSVSYCMYYE